MSWQKMKLGELCKLNYGKGLSASNRIKGKYAVYSSAGHIDSHCKPLIESKGIIIGRKGSIGTIFYSDSPFYPIDTTYFITPENNYNLKFLYYNLKTLGLKNLNSDAAVPGLNRNQAYSQEINIPSIQTQKRIADILSAYDDLIENNLKRIKLLEQAAQNIYKEWFVNMRFPSHENTPIDQETGLPEGWKTLKFDNVFNVQNGYAFKSKDYRNKGIPVLRTRDYSSSFFIDITDPIFLSDEFSVSHKKYFVKELDFLLIMVGASIGNNGLVLKKDLPALQNQNQWAIRVKSKFHSYEYFKIYCVKSIIDSLLMKRTGSARDFFRASFIKEIDVIIPDEDLVKQFTKFVKPLINQINILLTQNQKLISARDILLPRLMNQTIKV
tara:strand:+ start:359 stop:1507 length:1149 start_codon:yes stop_codon:yes gene_type:complete